MQKSVRLKSFELVSPDIADTDVDLLHALSLGVGWPHRPKDWDVLRRAGHGLVAVDGIGRVFGTAMWFPQGDDFATIGMVITSPRTQAQGNGKWLMDQILERSGKRHLSLNATHAAYNLYVSLGFVKEATVYQHQGEVIYHPPSLPAFHGELRRLSAEDFPEIAALDASAFGTSRTELLEILARDATIYGLLRNGEITGYALCREFGRGHVVGPIVASNDEDAIRLTAAHLESLSGQFARVDTREKDGAFADFLERNRFGIFGTVTTMTKGRRFPVRKPGKAWIYGLAGHALG
ncbi:GNAT family N-acetyltransferase [Mesorhizobium sp. SB112]|uniref:GNAT family N-acetyltransferase n=1 Tax=Mesorhizobium sp. SB112 TaxID=3151853 RepID=UPI003265E885